MIKGMKLTTLRDLHRYVSVNNCSGLAAYVEANLDKGFVIQVKLWKGLAFTYCLPSHLFMLIFFLNETVFK